MWVAKPIPYSAKQWQGKTLANPERFTKVLSHQMYTLKTGDGRLPRKTCGIKRTQC